MNNHTYREQQLAREQNNTIVGIWAIVLMVLAIAYCVALAGYFGNIDKFGAFLKAVVLFPPILMLGGAFWLIVAKMENE